MKVYLLTFAVLVLASIHVAQGQANSRLKMMSISQDSTGFRTLMKYANHFLLKPGESQRDLAEARRFANLALNLCRSLNKPLLRAEAKLLMAGILRESGNVAQSAPFIDDALAIYVTSNNPQGEGDALMEKRLLFDVEDPDQLQKRIQIVKQATLAYGKTKKIKKLADAWRELGDLHHLSAEFAEAVTDLKKSLALSHQIGEKSVQGTYDLLGIVNTELGNYDDAIANGISALRIAVSVGDTTMQLCTIYNRLGFSYWSVSDLDRALDCWQKALAIALKYDDEGAIVNIAGNIGAVYRKRKKDYRRGVDYSLAILTKYPSMHPHAKVSFYANLVIGYDRLRKYVDSEKYLKLLLSLEDKIKFEDKKRIILNAAIHHFLATKQLRLAQESIDIYHAKITNAPILRAQFHHFSFTLDSLRGNYQSAIKNFQLYKLYSDSISSNESEKRRAGLNIKFDIERKDQKIKESFRNIGQLKKQSVLQKQLIQKAQLNRNITAAFLVLSILFLGLLFSRYRTKQRTNRKLEQMVREREWLVREIHHRVKNNLQTIMSLLESQAGALKDDALTAIRDSQHRVQAMALIHRKLYLSDNLATINMPNYIRELVAYLRDSFDSSRRVFISMELEPLELDVTQAIPIGLILNEAATNTLKYAFPGHNGGNLLITLKKMTESNTLMLVIQDNGVGIPSEYLTGKAGSMGVKLINGLATELNGKVLISGENGTLIQVEFETTFDQPNKVPPRAEFMTAEAG